MAAAPHIFTHVKFDISAPDIWYVNTTAGNVKFLSGSNEKKFSMGLASCLSVSITEPLTMSFSVPFQSQKFETTPIQETNFCHLVKVVKMSFFTLLFILFSSQLN